MRKAETTTKHWLNIDKIKSQVPKKSQLASIGTRKNSQG
jgi:hypothetical protein